MAPECRHLLNWNVVKRSKHGDMILQVDVTLYDHDAAAQQLGYTNAAQYLAHRCHEARVAGAAARQ